MLGISGGQGLTQFGELGLAFVLSALIGLEREYRQKSAGLRTHTLVGVAAALFMLVSKYGFSDVLVSSRIVLDPSRVAAQIVSGIGFLGAGIIFVRRDAVRGLTTAAVVWLVAAIGMACGGGLAGLAIVVTASYFIALYALPALVRRLPVVGSGASTLRLEYEDGRGVLRRALAVCTGQRFRVTEVTIVGDGTPDATEIGTAAGIGGPRAISSGRRGIVDVELVVFGKGSITDLAARLKEVDGVRAVQAGDPAAADLGRASPGLGLRMPRRATHTGRLRSVGPMYRDRPKMPERETIWFPRHCPSGRKNGASA